MLLREWVPSIFDNNCATILLLTSSPTPPPDPRFIATESNSSKIITCNPSSPDFASLSASANNSLICFSDSPSHFDKSSGPLIILIDFAF